MFEQKNTILNADPIVNQIDTINPYFRAAMIVIERLQYDLHPYSWISRKKLKKIKGSHLGEKAVILCNGPSLNKTDFDTLNNVYTFGLNKINLLFNKTEFRPSCVVAVNPLVIEQNKDFYNATDIQLFLDFQGAKSKVNNNNNVIYLHSTRINRFARDCSMSICQGGTVTNVALQIAFHMGFKKVALIGCDHFYGDAGTPNMTVKSKDKDINHFDENYFSGNNLWDLPDLGSSEYSYRLAKRVYSTFGREIVNATVGGKLDVFERTNIDSFLADD